MTAGSTATGRPADRRGKLSKDPRVRYTKTIRRAIENEDLPLIRYLFEEAEAEVFTLRGLLPREDEIALGKLLTPKYQAGDSLLLLSIEIGRSTQYVAKLLRLAGVTIRPPYRPVMTVYPVNLAELRRRYEGGSSISSLAYLIHYSRDRTRAFLLKAGTELRPRHARSAPCERVQAQSAARTIGTPRVNSLNPTP